MTTDKQNSEISAALHMKSKGRGGPRTNAGKARSKRNATKHGIFSSVPVIEGESVAEYKSFRAAMLADRRPNGILQEFCVDKIVALCWQQKRKDRAELAEIEKNFVFILPEKVHAEIDAAEEICAKTLGTNLMSHTSNLTILERCIEHLEDLKGEIRRRGFEPDEDMPALTRLYGHGGDYSLYSSLRVIYKNLLPVLQLSEDQREQLKLSTPTECVQTMLSAIELELDRLKELCRTCKTREMQRMQLEGVSRTVLPARSLRKFIRYGASLDRSLERYVDLLRESQRADKRK